MPGPRVQSIPLLAEVPAGWAVPEVVEVRKGVAPGGHLEIIAFRNKKSGMACSSRAEMLNAAKPLPEWILQRIAAIV